MECPICNSNEFTPLYKLYDDRYGYPGEFQLRTCKTCSHASLEEKFTQDDIVSLYSNYYPRSGFNIEQYKPFIEEKGFMYWLNGGRSMAFRWVPDKVRILDIGCGFGESLGYHHKRGCDVYGVEADKNIKKIVDTHGFKIHQGVFKQGIYNSDYFDYITLDQVIEHISKPLDVLLEIKRILKPGGCVVISTPNANGWGANVFRRYWVNWHTPYHLQFFSAESMKVAASKAGLDMTLCKTITDSNWLLYQWLSLAYFPNKGERSPFWDINLLTSKRKRLKQNILLNLHKTKLNHLVTRLLDSFGIGDNYLFILKK